MVGEFENPSIRGIIPRSFDYIFGRIQQIQKEDPSSKYNVNIAFIQIYLEMIQDLFEPTNQVKIREDPEKGVFLDNCLWIKVKNTNDCVEAFKKGEKNRITECTRMNAHSSRSHALLIVKIERNFTDEESNEHIMTQGYLYLVDLAGSERVTKTNAREMRLEEAKKINYSLLILGNCIQSLTSPNSKFVSYRDSKLTRILQESLGGNAKTSLIVTISPSGYNSEETLSALNFGLRAMKVQNKPVINRAQDYQAMCFKLQEEYDKLMEQYSRLRIEYDKVCDENEKLKSGEIFLNMQKNSIKQQIKNNKNERIISQEDMEKIKKKFEKDIANLEMNYNEVLKNKEEENLKIMKEIDNTLVKKDNEIQKLYNKINEYELKIKNITETNYDINKEVEDLKKTCNDMLLEKEQLILKINQLSQFNQNLTKNMNILNKVIEDKKNSLIDKKIQTEFYRIDRLTQTDPIINPKIRELLFKYKISEIDINNNNFPKILTQLLIGMETMSNDANINNAKIKKLNESIAIITKNYEDKLKNINIENSQLKNNIINLSNEKKEIYNEKNNFKIQKENELLNCKNQIDALEIRVKQIDEDKNNFEEIKKEYENQIKEYENQIKELNNDNKVLNMNTQSIDSELKIIKNNLGINEKNLNKSIIQFNNDNNIFNQFQKQLKKIDTIIDNDLVIINNNNFEYNLNKAKTEGIKFQTMLEEINNNNSNLSTISNSEINNNNKTNNNNITELISKINEYIQENKNNSINFIKMINKLYNKYIDLFKKYKNSNIEYEKNNAIKNQKNIKNEEKLKNNIISVTNENIDKFSSMCYNNNTNDLKEELNNLQLKSNEMNSFDVLKIALDILGKLLLRTSSYKDEKELEIENLNGKIIYLLSELDIYRKNLNLNADNNNNSNNNELQMINNQLELKNDEINRLNKDIDDYLIKIKELSCENNLLKNNKKINKIDNINNNNYSKNDNIYMKNNFKNNKNNNIYGYSNQNNNNINNINKYNIKNTNSQENNARNNIYIQKTKNDDFNNYNENSDSENNNDNYMSDEEIENDIVKKQNDIEKIQSQLRELNEKETENENHNNY